jgi:hypothetical protein
MTNNPSPIIPLVGDCEAFCNRQARRWWVSEAPEECDRNQFCPSATSVRKAGYGGAEPTNIALRNGGRSQLSTLRGRSPVRRIRVSPVRNVLHTQRTEPPFLFLRFVGLSRPFVLSHRTHPFVPTRTGDIPYLHSTYITKGVNFRATSRLPLLFLTIRYCITYAYT